MIEVFKRIGAVSRSNNATNILVLGESGTGKELVSQQIHSWGEKPDAPFIPINVTTLPDTLIESEWFGYEVGTFTGADKRKIGRFEQAGDGTLVLDEIGGLSLSLQKKVLRILQEREFYRLGGQEVIPVRCRIIAVTNADLPGMVAMGKFRNDLYFRLKVVTIKLPLLRERIDDIPLLADYFIQQHAKEMKILPPVLSNEAIDYLCSYDWPGNVRELQNAIIQAMVYTHSDILTPADFPDIAQGDNLANLFDCSRSIEEARRINNEFFERRFISDGLSESGGNVGLAAEKAGITPQRYYQLMKKYNILANTYKR